ncbi:MAG: ferritin family protein [Endomicrobiales bacterium]|jgi:rubrerythrin
MVNLWRCEICGDPYIGEAAPDNCPFCGAHRNYIKEAKDAHADFTVILTQKDRETVLKALEVEVSNATFYFCAAKKTDSVEGQQLFKALGKVESEHASIWKKILNYQDALRGDDACFSSNRENLEESHRREIQAIEFYRTAAAESDDQRIKEIFTALVEVESDHLYLSQQRLKNE